MTLTAQARGAPDFINVTSAAALQSAWAAAKGGEVITLTQTVPAFEWTMAASKPRNGVCVILPVAQPLKLVATAADLNTEIIGGTYSSFAFNGLIGVSGPSGYGIHLNGCSKLAIRGAFLSQSHSCVVGQGASDITIQSVITEWATADSSQWIDCDRVVCDDWFGRTAHFRGEKIRVFNNGSAPIDGASNGTVANSKWYDAAHNDLFQFRDGCTDLTVSNFDQHCYGQGIGSFGTGVSTRVLVEDCDIRTISPNAINISAEDATLRGCTVGVHPTISTDNVPILGMSRFFGSTLKLQGGQNTVLAGAQAVNPPANGTNAAVNLTSSTINGDAGVTLPTAPSAYRLPWAPAVTRPTYVPYTGLSEIVIRQVVYAALTTDFRAFSSDGTAPVGYFLTMGLGNVRVFPTSREFRWLRNGTPVTGTHSNRVLDTTGMTIGDVIVGQQRTTNAAGTTDWVSSASVTLT